MAQEGNRAENSSSPPAPSTSQEPQAPPQEATEEETCPICLGTVNDEASVDWCRHTFCFICIVEWSRVKAVCPICQWPFTQIYRKVGPSDYAVYHLAHLRPTRRVQVRRAQCRSALRRRRRPSGHQQHRSASGDEGRGRAGTPERAQSRSPRRRRGGHSTARGRSPLRHQGGQNTARSQSLRRHRGGHNTARSRSTQRCPGGHNTARSRTPSGHHGGNSAAPQAQLYSPSSRRRRQQSRAQDTAHTTGAEEGQSPRRGRNVPASSRRTERRGHRLSSREQKPTKSRSRRRSRNPGRRSQQQQ